MNNLTDEVSSGDEAPEDNNQTTTEVPSENESNQNTNQTIETQTKLRIIRKSISRITFR